MLFYVLPFTLLVLFILKSFNMLLPAIERLRSLPSTSSVKIFYCREGSILNRDTQDRRLDILGSYLDLDDVLLDQCNEIGMLRSLDQKYASIKADLVFSSDITVKRKALRGIIRYLLEHVLFEQDWRQKLSLIAFKRFVGDNFVVTIHLSELTPLEYDNSLDLIDHLWNQVMVPIQEIN